MMAWAWLAFAFLDGGSLRVARRMAWGSRALPESRAGAAALAAKAGRSALQRRRVRADLFNYPFPLFCSYILTFLFHYFHFFSHLGGRLHTRSQHAPAAVERSRGGEGGLRFGAYVGASPSAHRARRHGKYRGGGRARDLSARQKTKEDQEQKKMGRRGQGHRAASPHPPPTGTQHEMKVRPAGQGRCAYTLARRTTEARCGARVSPLHPPLPPPWPPWPAPPPLRSPPLAAPQVRGR